MIVNATDVKTMMIVLRIPIFDARGMLFTAASGAVPFRPSIIQSSFSTHCRNADDSFLPSDGLVTSKTSVHTPDRLTTIR